MQRDKLDSEIRTFIESMSAAWREHPPLDTLSVIEARAIAEQVRAPWTKGGPAMAQTSNHVIETGNGPIRIRVYVPHNCASPAPTLIYAHGGGFTLFSIDTHDRLMREYADRGCFAVLGVDYPLSPEAKFPVALDLITALVLWLKDNSEALGIDARRLALGGDSAGANLSVSTCLRLRDRGELGLVKALLSNYGGYALGCSDESEALYGGPDSVLQRAESYYFFGNYLADLAQAADPYACPINADLTGLPPIFMAIAECDIVAEHNLEMAQKFRAAGVNVASKVYRGATHSFLEAMSVSRVAREAIADGADFIAKQLAAAPERSP